MYEISNLQFSRPTTGIKLGSDNMEESRTVIAFFTILKAIWILCSFRLANKAYMSAKTMTQNEVLLRGDAFDATSSI